MNNLKLTMRKLTTILLLLAAIPFGHLTATGDSLHYLTPKDTIFLKIDAFGEKYFKHRLERKQTLFSLAKFYGMTLEELYFYNPSYETEPPGEGAYVKIPIPNRAIIRKPVEAGQRWKMAPVFYTVGLGETMYRIAKNHFKLEVETLMSWNKLTSTTLSPDQKLFVGWMQIDGIPADYRVSPANPAWKECYHFGKTFYRDAEGLVEMKQTGAAFWQKESVVFSEELLALHREVPPGGIVEVRNPMSKKVIFVKVLGTIPDTAYSNDILIVLSNKAAKMLGARDPKFFVEMKYFKKTQVE